MSHDVVIVGGGAIGLACAWRTAQRGMDVCVLERGRPGGGASHAAAGMLAPLTEADFDKQELLELSLAAGRAYPVFVEELEEAGGLEVGYRRCGALQVALDRDEAAELRRLHGLQLAFGLEAEWLRPRRCRELEPGLTTACASGVHAPGEAQVDPRALTRALLAAVERAGGTVVAGTEVTGALLAGSRLAGVKTGDGSRYPAEHVVLASGCWSGQARWLPEGARPPVRPVKGQILRLRGPADEPLCEGIVRTSSIYVVSRGDGHAVLGATVEERGFDTTVTAGGVHELLREAHRVLPGIGELELVEATAGLRPGTPDSAPLIGPGAIDGLILATGHYRNGILLAPPTADAVEAILAGEQPAVSVAAFGPHRFDRAHAPRSSDAHLPGTSKEPHAEHAGLPPPPGRPLSKPGR